MADPFELLRLDDAPVHPTPHFAALLRRRLLDIEDLDMTDPSPSTRPVAPTAPARTAHQVEHTVTPYLVVSDAAAAIDFYVEVLGAIEHHRLLDGSRIGHAEIIVGDTRLAIADEYPEYDIVGPNALGGSPVALTVLVDDADATFATAIAAGATALRPPADQFHGHRTAQVRDPWGHRWTLSTPIHQRYREEATAEGFTYVPGPGETAAGDETGIDQRTHHRRGDLYYFTLPTADLGRAQRFFGEVLGWRFSGADTGHVDNISAPPGGLRERAEGYDLWFVVDDIHAAVERVRALGGTADDPVRYDSGWSALCVDDQGTRFGLSVPTARYTR